MDPLEDDLFVVDDDDLVFAQLLSTSAPEEQPPPPRRRTVLHLPHPPRPPSPRPRGTRRPERSMQTQTDLGVIDLTAEPDSPVRERRTAASSSRAVRNPRRTSSQRISPPQLARSDSTLFTPSTGVIDLTADSPEESRPSDSTRGAARRPHHHHHHHHIHHTPHRHPNHIPHVAHGQDELAEFQYYDIPPGAAGPTFAIGLSRRFAGLFGNNINMINLPPHLDITRTAFMAREPSPKPAMDPVPPARDGFTRDTCADPEKAEESVVICPACEEELAYDPTETTPAAHTPTKKRKRAAGEHHFWALKKCGHVYCADCFDNRRPTKANPLGVGFQTLDGRAPASAINDLRCVVEGCETKVTSKSEWVGIFL